MVFGSKWPNFFHEVSIQSKCTFSCCKFCTHFCSPEALCTIFSGLKMCHLSKYLHYAFQQIYCISANLKNWANAWFLGQNGPILFHEVSIQIKCTISSVNFVLIFCTPAALCTIFSCLKMGHLNKCLHFAFLVDLLHFR